MININSLDEINSFIKNTPFTLIYFYSQNCSVCHALYPKLELLLNDFPSILSIKVDISLNPEIAAKYSIFSSPALIFITEENEIFRYAGIISLYHLNEHLNRILTHYFS